MKVLHSCPLPLFSGLEQYALLVATEQKKLGLPVHFIVQAGSALESECAKAGIRTHVVDVYGKKSLPGAVRQYHQLLKDLPDVDVIHTHTSHDIERLALTLPLLGLQKNWLRPKVIQQNHIWTSHSKRDPLHWLTYRVLDEIWCSSTMAKRDLERYLPVPSHKIKVIPYGRDLSIRDSFLSREDARRELGLPQDGVVIGAIARIDKAKGIWELLQASLKCLEEGHDFTLALIGGPTLNDPAAVAFSAKVDRFSKELGEPHASRIRLLGSLPNAGRYLRGFDVYAQASYKETFSLALLDAQLAELPVIGTDSGGTPEVVRETETGWLAKPESIESFTEAMRRALRERTQWKAFGSTARLRVEKDYDLNHVIRKIVSSYGFGHEQ